MGGGFQYLDLIFFGIVAVFLVLRLRSVLGKRTGNERRRDPFAGAPTIGPPMAGLAAISGIGALGARAATG